jgi:type IVB pilus formation R64 PilN family outer membrane protein
MMRTYLAAAISTLFFVSGCTGLSNKIDTNIDQTDSKASALLKDTGRTKSAAGADPVAAVMHERGIWLGKNVVKLGNQVLPAIFHEPAVFDRTVNSLSELAERITLRAGIPTRVSPDALVAANAASRPAGNALGPAPTAPAGSAAPAPAASPAGGAAPMPNAGVASTTSAPVRIVYANGNFKGLLDTVAARFGVSWRYANGAIQFFHTDSRTFQINAIPGDASFTANVVSGAATTGGTAGGSGPGAGAGAGSGVSTNNSQTTGVVSRLSVYTSIENSVRAMLSAHGKAVASPATGAITVVDTPETLERIAAYIEDENKALSRQIVVNVTVLSVSLGEGDELGINWDLVYRSLREQYGMQNLLASRLDSTAFSAGIVGSADSKFAGTSLIINALSKQGKVRRQTTASVVTLNNQPVPVQVARQTTYLQSSQTTVVAQIGATTTLTPGMVTSGFNMSILPHVLTNGTVMLQFSTDISALRRIREVSSNGSKIESPEMDTRNFLQRVAMKSNETLIISGFEQTDENLDRHGVGHPSNYLLGGGFQANSSKEVIVVLVTPSMVAGS